MKRLIASGIVLALSQACLAEGSPWLAEPGTTALSISQVQQSSDGKYKNEKLEKTGPELELDTTWLTLNHGLTDDLAIDFKVGYANSRHIGGDTDSGLADTNVGISYRLVDEFIRDDSLPSTVLRAGVIIAGDYEEGNVQSAGDGADGFELSVISGKLINSYVALSGELGYRVRNSDVPDELFYKLGAYILPAQGWTLSVAYSNTDARDGLDIGGVGFTGSNFNELEEDSELVDLGISYSLNNQVSVGFNAGQVIDGKNTGNTDAYALTLGYSF